MFDIRVKHGLVLSQIRRPSKMLPRRKKEDTPFPRRQGGQVAIALVRIPPASQWEARRWASWLLLLSVGQQRVVGLARRHRPLHHSDHAYLVETHAQGCAPWRDEYSPARLAQVAQGSG